jgi:hypothetical protein
VTYFRTREDWIMHLAIELSETSASELSAKRTAGTPCDLICASSDETTEALAMLKRAGIRTPDEAPPAWHFASNPASRATKAPSNQFNLASVGASAWKPDPSYRP